MASVTPGQLFEVVGGASTGGVLARQGRALDSPELPKRLAHGALVRARALEGERLHFELAAGAGPQEGWVSLRFKGRDLLVHKQVEIAIVSLGSRGDWQPPICLARGLKEAGHSVFLFGLPGMIAWGAKHGIPGRALITGRDLERDVMASTSSLGGLEGMLPKVRTLMEAFDANADGALNFEESRELFRACEGFECTRELYDFVARENNLDPDVGLTEEVLVSMYATKNTLHRDYVIAKRRLGRATEEEAAAAAEGAAATDDDKLLLICPVPSMEDSGAFIEEMDIQRPLLLLNFCHHWTYALWSERLYGNASLSLSYYPYRMTPFGTLPDEEGEKLRGVYQEQLDDEKANFQPVFGVAPLARMGYDGFVKRFYRRGYLTSFSSLVQQDAAIEKVGLSPDRAAMVRQDIYTGSWFMEEVPEAGQDGGKKKVAEEFGGPEGLGRLEAFLAEGPAVYMGWGSCVSRNARFMAKLAVEALKEAGLRGIILGGWAGVGLEALREAVLPRDTLGLCEYADRNVLFVQQAPHSWLFERCSCVVHHGGAGTTGAAMRSGSPMIVTPIWGDQPITAEAVRGADLGLALPAMAGLKAQDLAAALREATTNPERKRRAEEVRASVMAEAGVKGAVKYVQDYLETEVRSGKYWQEMWGKAKPLRSRR